MKKKTLFSLFIVTLVSFYPVRSIHAAEDCTINKDAFMALSREALNELIQVRADNNQEGIKKLAGEGKIFPSFGEMVVEVKGEEEGKFYNIVIPAFRLSAWVVKEDLNCIELVAIPDLDYFPLQVGNMWEYKFEGTRNGEKIEKTHSILISEKVENEDGSVLFLNDGKPYIFKFKDSIVAEKGNIMMKLPLRHGLRWQSKGEHSGERFLMVRDVGFTFELNGTKYEDCIRIISKSDYHALMKKDGVQYTAFEAQNVYAPDVGLIQTDLYEILRETGKRNHVGVIKLVTFKKNQPVATVNKETTPESDEVKLVNSFRFPERHFLHPYISPNEKWLSYYKSDTIWEELYYTEVGKSEKNIVPVFPKDISPKEDRKTVGGRSWSPDGNILAVEIEIGYDEYISIIDFSSGIPKLLETFKGENATFIESTGELLFLDEFGNIEKKELGSPPEHLVFVRTSYKIRNEVTNYQVAAEGTIIYTTGHPKKQAVYLTTLKNPDKKILLYEDTAITENDSDSTKLSALYNLSPNGKYVLFYVGGGNIAIVFNLHTQEVIDEITLYYREKPVWSPDGSMVAYLEKSQQRISKDNSDNKETLNPKFYIYNIATGEKIDFGISVFTNFNWTPNSSNIIYSGKFAHDAFVSVEQGIFVLDLKGKEVGKISSISSSGSPVISSSGKYVIWASWDYDTFFMVKNPYQSIMK